MKEFKVGEHFNYHGKEIVMTVILVVADGVVTQV